MGRYRGVELVGLTLEGPRLTLRPWRRSDAARVFEVLQDESMHRFLSLPHPYTVDAAKTFVGRYAPDARRDATALEVALTERQGGRLVGSAALRLGAHPEIGYWIAPAARGHGYAAEATRALADWGFAAGMRRISVLFDVRNVASARTALAAGFAFEGVSRDALLSAAATADGVPAESERRGDLARFARLASDPGEPVTPRLPALPPDGLGDAVLSLRVTQPDDAGAMLAAEDEVARQWGFPGWVMDETAVRAMAGGAGLHWLVGPRTSLSMIDLATGSYAGGLSVRMTGPPGVLTLGYAVHPAFRGRGYTTRALRLFADWAFTQAGVARLELGARTGNLASQHAARNAGFVPEGVFAGRLAGIDGNQHDEARFALVNPRA